MTPESKERLKMGATITKREAQTLEREAVKSFRSATTGNYDFAVKLRKLFESNAHLLRGFQNFKMYAAELFTDLAPDSVVNMTRVGHVLLRLAEAKKLKLDDRELYRQIGTTALRRLSGVPPEMLIEVYDLAVELRQEGRPIVDETVRRALAVALPQEVAPKETPEARAERESEESERLRAIPEPPEPDEPVAVIRLDQRVNELTQMLMDMAAAVTAEPQRARALVKIIAAETKQIEGLLEAALKAVEEEGEPNEEPALHTRPA